MNILSKFKNKFVKNVNVNDNRLTFINDDEAIRLYKIREYKVWANGDASEKLNFYTSEKVDSMLDNAIYNRNVMHYFWSVSTKEKVIKRTSCDFASSIISALTNVCGLPKITFKSEEDKKIWDLLCKENNFANFLIQQVRSDTLTTGTSVLKVNFDTTFSNVPSFECVDAEKIRIEKRENQIVAVIFENDYFKNKKSYKLFEIRRREKNNSYIEYELYEDKENNELERISLESLDETKDLQNLTFTGVNSLLCVPVIYFKNVYYKNYGRSVLEGKITLLDNLDQCLSQAALCVRVSTPVEYFSEDILERDKSTGEPKVPSCFNRQYVKKPVVPNGDGEINDPSVITTQPNVDFAQYSIEANAIKMSILDGLISPSTLGIEVSRNDNALAQREKEKTTLFTRNKIIANEKECLEKFIRIAIATYKFLQNGLKNFKIDEESEISIKYDEFANPSFETELPILGNAWSNGQISTEQYVSLLWGDKLSDEDKQKEIEELNKHRLADTLDINEYEKDISTEERTEK